MSAYTSIKIDGIDVWVDPDSLQISSTNIIAVNRSMLGTSYITSYNSNSMSRIRMVNISSALLPHSSAAALDAIASKKIPVRITATAIAGLDGQFIIKSFNMSPIKPLVKFPNESEIKYNYSISLEEVSE